MVIAVFVETLAAVVVFQCVVQCLCLLEQVVVQIVHVLIVQIGYINSSNRILQGFAPTITPSRSAIGSPIIAIEMIALGDHNIIGFLNLLHILLAIVQMYRFLQLVIIQRLISLLIIKTGCMADFYLIDHLLVQLVAQVLPMVDRGFVF